MIVPGECKVHAERSLVEEDSVAEKLWRFGFILASRREF